MRISEQEANEMWWEDFYRKRYESNLSSHHDCSDPDHPGCELCEENEDDN